MKQAYWGMAMTAAALVLTASPVWADGLAVTLGGGWDGVKIPSGQQCTLDGGNGATPPMTVSGLPDGTARVTVAFNDRDYPPLSSNGGHGVIAFPVTPVSGSADIPAVPGLSSSLPGGAEVVSAARSSGDYASPGYLPPCSGGDRHAYWATVTAVAADGAALSSTTVELGRW